MKEYASTKDLFNDLLGTDLPSTEDIAQYFLEMAQSADEDKIKQTAEALDIDPEEFAGKLDTIRKLYHVSQFREDDEDEDDYFSFEEEEEIDRLKAILDKIDIPEDKIDDHLFYGRILNNLIGELIREKYKNGEAWDEKYDRDISPDADEILEYMSTPDHSYSGISMDPGERDEVMRSAAIGKEICLLLREAAADKVEEYQKKYIEQNVKDLMAGKYKSIEDVEANMPLYRKYNPDGSFRILNVPTEILAWGMFIATINEGYLPATR